MDDGITRTWDRYMRRFDRWDMYQWRSVSGVFISNVPLKATAMRLNIIPRVYLLNPIFRPIYRNEAIKEYFEFKENLTLNDHHWNGPPGISKDIVQKNWGHLKQNIK